jgi:phage/plasmid-like protein (TIGR03299 family)
MTTIPRPAYVDVNQAFATERAAQLEAVADRRADFERRVAAGTLTPIGGGRFRVTDPTSLDNGEIWSQQGGVLMPQHGLDQTTGQPALYTTVPAWHGLGTVVPGGTSGIDEVLALGRIGFTVARRPVLFQNELGGPTRVLADQFVTVRSDTGAGLGCVGARYEVIDNREAFWFLQDLVDQFDVTWESAGALREGRKVFVSMRLPETVTIDPDGIRDEIVPFIVAINSHDGSTLFHVPVTPCRPTCSNTERFALRDANSRWGVRHTRNALERVNEARRTLGLSIHYFQRFTEEEQELAQTNLEVDAFRDLAEHLWPNPGSDAPIRARNTHDRRLTELTELFETTSNHLGRTAYGAERTITHFVDWRTRIRPTGSLRGQNLAARATAMLEGTTDEVKTRAHRKLLTLIHR